LENQKQPYLLQVEPEQHYTFEDYRTIIRLEKERMGRLIDTHEYIHEGDKLLVDVTQPPAYRFSDTSLVDQNSINLYQRYGANTAFYGVPQRPPNPTPKHHRPDAFKLATPKETLPEYEVISALLSSSKKVICTSAFFWANYHYLLHSEADQTGNAFYGWEEEIPQIPVELATPCFRHSPFTFQSWLLYRAPCEEECLIVADENQFRWIMSHAAEQLPQDTRILIVTGAEIESVAGAERVETQTSFKNRFFLKHLKKASSDCVETLDSTLPKISVIVCSYNQGEFLEKCLKSILDQNYPNLELIVVDGNSTDDSTAILERYRTQCAHLLIEDDNGQSDALNKGFTLATGEVMTWVCSDDGLEEGSLFKVGQTYAANASVDIVVGGCRRIDPNGRPLSVHHTHLPYNQEVRLSFGDMISFGHTWLRSFYFIQPELFWSRRIWEKSGGYVKNHMFFAMDYELFLRFALAGAKALHISDCLAFALVHDAQKSAHMGRNLPTISRMMTEFEDMLAQADK